MKHHALRVVVLSLLALSVAGAAFADVLRGTVQWAQKADLATPLSGVVAEVAVSPGQRVATGAALVTLDRREYHAAHQRAAARVTGLRSALQAAELELERARTLYDLDAIADQPLAAARRDLAKARADVAVAQADHTKAMIDLERTVIRAPFDARVLQVYAYPGQVVVNRMRAVTLVTVMAADRLQAQVALEAGQYDRLHVGMPARVRVAEREVAGVITQLRYAPEREAAYVLSVEFPYSQGIRLGQHVSVELP